ncbi:uracil-DNA glycosylase family protein [Leptospira alstonii]|uniref:uracil-DNA glycosylase family protein n=1 Tax=Leptospira alstonii TaxID=28452 RepID=UPI000ADD08E8|nr:uracil-DNA glycosylase family protein [Leptospira alstonii]
MAKHELSDALFEIMQSSIKSYPCDYIEPVRNPLKDIVAFFPGGKGCTELHNDSPESFQVMVLGQDFGTLDEFNQMNKYKERKSPTWLNFEKLANQVGLSLETCFFTNAIMGLRNGGKSTGPSPAIKTDSFYEENLKFLGTQIEFLKPKVIIVLGTIPAQILSELSNDLSDWKNFRFRNVDNLGKALNFNVKFDGLSVESTCVAIVHPSFRHIHAKKRSNIHSGRKLLGDEAEIQLLRDALGIVEKR